tara:strand:- start:362 stop:811 length:450 start_codon:yes stop_codon:yes gene_type:complete
VSFADEPFHRRIQTMGDIAERAFEEVSEVNFVRYGLNRPPLNMASLPLTIRHTPDYLTSNNLVEVQGLGKDQVLKMKLEKMKALGSWHRMHKVQLFVYDSTNDRSALIEYNDLQKMCRKAAIESFPEGKQYYAIPAGLVWVDEPQGNTN